MYLWGDVINIHNVHNQVIQLWNAILAQEQGSHWQRLSNSNMSWGGGGFNKSQENSHTEYVDNVLTTILKKKAFLLCLSWNQIGRFSFWVSWTPCLQAHGLPFLTNTWLLKSNTWLLLREVGLGAIKTWRVLTAKLSFVLVENNKKYWPTFNTISTGCLLWNNSSHLLQMKCFERRNLHIGSNDWLERLHCSKVQGVATL